MRRSSWLLLLYALPTRQTAERVNVWRKFKKFGAVQLKNSAYFLPDAALHLERFQWLAKQVRDAGGEATLIQANRIEGFSNEQIAGMFNQERAKDYREVIEQLKGLSKRKRKDPETNSEIEKVRKRMSEIREIDFFDCPAAHDAEMFLARMHKKRSASEAAKLKARDYQGRTWLTRPRPEIDRVGSAWLIRRFIDAKARFVFATNPAEFPDAVPYDMSDVEFTHHGDDCTFETLVKRFGIEDKAASQMGEMIHDADLEDEKFGRIECIGIDRVLKGFARMGLKDAEILERGFACFEALYRQLQK
jgi:hypothetical protein